MVRATLFLCCVAVIVGLACASSTTTRAASSRALGSSPVRLSFAWPADLQGEVFARTAKIRSDGRERPERSVETRHRIRTEPHERGLRVVAEDLQILRVDGQDRPMTAPMSDPNMLFLAPTLVVGKSGEVLEVEGLDALRRSIAERAAASPTTAERAGQVAAIAASQDRVTAHWNSAVHE
jgi:hypothetical protein